MSTANLTGRWTGHYIHWGDEHPITADLFQEGKNLSGSMVDGQCDKEYSLFQVAAEAGLPPGADEEIEAAIRRIVPDATADPVRYVSHLPNQSILKGACKGRTVYFLKTYQGKAFSGHRIGDRFLGMEKEGHKVHYEGQLSPDDCEIDGRWWIEADPKGGTARTEGLFILRRSDATANDPVEPAYISDVSPRPWWKFWS